MKSKPIRYVGKPYEIHLKGYGKEYPDMIKIKADPPVIMSSVAELILHFCDKTGFTISEVCQQITENMAKAEKTVIQMKKDELQ